MKTYKGLITELPENGIFVFGSNTQGRHGKGSALVARQKFGAIYGQAKGLQGRSYAIITKDLTKNIHPSYPMDYIIDAINNLYECINNIEGWKDKLFYVAYSGTGKNLNGFTNEQMALFFRYAGDIPDNMVFEEEFAKLLNNVDMSNCITIKE